jgi:glycosyltransferase involved in cell wall biosynthesis
MKISACVITKNEEKNITKWLQVMSEVADEIIVVDTGSSDHTVNIAKTFKAKIYNFKWIGDFSAAKNFAIEKCTGDWILFLDADEYFTPNSCKIIRNVISKQNKNKKIGSIMCPLVNIDTDDHDRVMDTVLHMRIFRNLPYLRYVGKIHERLIDTKKKTQAVVINELEIYHTGYSRSIRRKKAERNIKVILEQVAKEGESRDNIIFLMDAYNSLSQYDKAIEYAQKAIDLNVRIIGMESHPYSVLINAMVAAGKAIKETIQTAKKAMEKFPSESQFYMLYGYLSYKDKDYISAEEYILKGIALAEKFKEARCKNPSLTDNFSWMLHVSYETLGNIMRMKGDINKAANYFVEGIKCYSYNPGLLRGLYMCIKDADYADIIQVLNGYYNPQKDGGYICQTLLGIAEGKICAYYAKKADNNMSVADSYMAIERYESAAIELSDTLSQHYRRAIVCAREENIETDVALNILLPEKYSKILHGQLKQYNQEEMAVGRLQYWIHKKRESFV